MKRTVFLGLIWIMFAISENHYSEAAYCDELESFPNGKITASSNLPYPPGTELTFSCDSNFELKGVTKTSCARDGRWSDPFPYCRAAVCRRDASKLEPGRKCRKPCRSNSDCRGSAKRCLCDDWCGRSCIRVDGTCPTPSNPENGYIITTKFTHGSTVTYGCDYGYSVVGQATRICFSDLKWSGSAPSCAGFTLCGQKMNKDEDFGKVIHGTAAKPGEWPWQALFFYAGGNYAGSIYDEDNGFGGGSIIDNKWILTAAHNFDDFEIALKTNKYWETEFLISLGLTKHPNSGQPISDRIKFFEPSKIYRHPKYDDTNYDYDVALVRVGNRLKVEGNKFVVDSDAPVGLIPFSGYVRPVCLPCMREYPHDVSDVWNRFDSGACNLKSKVRSTSRTIRRTVQGRPTTAVKRGENMWVTGFGYKRDPDKEDTFKPKVLQQGLLKILEDDRCEESVRSNREKYKNDPTYRKLKYTDRMFCAGSANESLFVDSCSGDSGGALVKELNKGTDSNSWIAMGIVSWGYECGSEDPGFYTLLPLVMSWVAATANSFDPSTPDESSGCNIDGISGRVNIIKGTRIMKANDKVLLGEVLSLKCMDSNEAVLGQTVITCEGLNQWSRDPRISCSKSVCIMDVLPKIFDVHQDDGEIVDLAPFNVASGQSLKFLCREGDSTQISVVCQNGHWSPKIPTSCGHQNCQELDGIENGWLITRGVSVGHTAQYKCDEGYMLSGNAERSCLSTGEWSGHEPKCLGFNVCGQSYERQRPNRGKVVNGRDAPVGAWPWHVSIRSPGDVSGGSIISNKWILTAATVVEYRNDNLEIHVGISRLRPLTDDAMVFEAKNIIQHPQYDSVTFDYDVALVSVGKRLKKKGNGFVVDPSAPEGIIIFSANIRPVCLPCVRAEWNGWNRMDSAETCDSTVPAGSRVIITGFGRTEIGGGITNKLQEGVLKTLDGKRCIKAVEKIRTDTPSVRFTSRMLCAEGMNGSAKIDACSGDGGGPLVKQVRSGNTNYWVQIGIVSWGHGCGIHPGFYTSMMSVMPWILSVVDTAKTDERMCPKPPVVRNGLIVGKDYRVGKRIQIRCDEGYKPTGTVTSVCEETRKWSSVLACIPITCSIPPPFENGIAIGGKYFVGSVLEFRCHDGYVLVGDSTTKCMSNGKWGEYPVCKDADPCQPNPCNAGGRCIEWIDGAVCFCKLGYSGKFCEKHNVCSIRKISTNVQVYKGALLLDATETVHQGQKLTLKCAKSDFVIVGESSITCNGPDKWSRSTNVVCAKNCQKPPPLDNGFFLGEKYVVGSVLQVRCNKGYTLTGHPTTKCRPDGTWDAFPVCTRNRCGKISTPANSNLLIFPSTARPPYDVGVKVTYNCDRFYRRKGPRTIKCLEDGVWSHPPPTCEEVGCLLFHFDLNYDVYVEGRESQDILAQPGDQYVLKCKSSLKATKVECVGRDIWKPNYYDVTCE